MKSARCILEWHSTYIKNDAHFAPDGRGKHERDYWLSNEDLRLQFVVQMKTMAGAETLTFDAAVAWVNNELLSSDYSEYLNPFNE